MYQVKYTGIDHTCSQSSLWSVCSFHRYSLSEPRPSPPGAGARTRGPGEAPCCARRGEGSEAGRGWRGARRGTGRRKPAGRADSARRGARASASRSPRPDAPGAGPPMRARRGTAHSERAAGRSRPVRPGGPASRLRPRAAHLCPPTEHECEALKEWGLEARERG